MKFDISYIIATRNRLPFLTITVQKLLEELQPGEEIVIVDGNSTDGTKLHQHSCVAIASEKCQSKTSQTKLHGR